MFTQNILLRNVSHRFLKIHFLELPVYKNTEDEKQYKICKTNCNNCEFLLMFNSICLLMKASKHAEAVEVAEKWLCFEDNFSQQNYLEVTEFYIKHVLLPQKLNEKVQQFLETNRALTPEQRHV